MGALSVRLPESTHKALKKYSKEEKVSINQFIVNAVIEKIAYLERDKYLEERAARGDIKEFKKVLDLVPDVEPEPFDKL